MAVDSKLKAELLKKLDINQSTLYARAARIRAKLDMDVDDSIYLLALQERMKIKRYLKKEKVDKVRDIQLKYNSVTRQPSPVTATKAARRISTNSATIIKMPSGVPIDDPLLPNSIKGDAKRMAGIYPWFYYLENSIRTFICAAMERYEDPDWWKHVNPDLVKKVDGRKKNENRNAWHQKRSDRDIDYLDFKDLISVLSSNAHRKLKQDGILPSGDWVDTIIRAVKESRNVIAHMNPLMADSVKSVEVRVKEWNRQVKAKYKLLAK